MDNLNSELAQINTSSSIGIFNQLQKSVSDFNQSNQTEFFPELEDIINLTGFEQNLTSLTGIIEEEDECDKSFDSTLSANEFDDDLDFDIDVNEYEHIIEDTIAEFPMLKEIMEDDLHAVEIIEQIDPQLQLPDIQDIKPEILTIVPVKIPIMNHKKEVIREEFHCTICKRNFTVLSSLVRHSKTQKHQRMLSYQQFGQFVPNVSMPVENHVQYQPETQFQPVQRLTRASTIEQKRKNFTQRIQISRNSMIDLNRMIATKEESNDSQIMIIEDITQEKVQIIKDLVNSGCEESVVQFNQLPAKTTTTQNATKSAIENSIKILSKLNTENASNLSEPTIKTESSPKKQSLKQLTLKDMTCKNLATTQQDVHDEVLINQENLESAAVIQTFTDFNINADDLSNSFNPVPDLPQNNPISELAKYIQELPEEFYLDQDDEQLQYQIVISGDEFFTITSINDPQQPKQSNLQKKMSQKRQERILKDISMSYEAYKCNSCSKVFSTRSNLRRHQHLHGPRKLHQCSLCGKAFMQKEYLKKHLTSH